MGWDGIRLGWAGIFDFKIKGCYGMLWDRVCWDGMAWGMAWGMGYDVMGKMG